MRLAKGHSSHPSQGVSESRRKQLGIMGCWGWGLQLLPNTWAAELTGGVGRGEAWLGVGLGWR